jgi:hypothetical protein
VKRISKSAPSFVIFLLSGLAGLTLIAGAAIRDDNGMFGEITAAMLQAVFSVVAIVAVIWIDFRAAKRLSDERQVARTEAVRAREGAVYYCRNVLDVAAHQVRTVNIPSDGSVALPAAMVRKLAAAEGAIRYILRQSVELSPPLLMLLSETEQRMAQARGEVGGAWAVNVHESTRPAIMLAFGTASAELLERIEDYKIDIMDIV